VLFGVLFIANISTGHPFVLPVGTPVAVNEAIGHDIFSGAVWFLFFWSLRPFIVEKYLKTQGRTK
jgi:hypothetical protein